MPTEQPEHSLILDVSQWQGSAPSTKLLSALASPALAVRVSVGTSEVDTMAKTHITVAREAGIPVIGYHALTTADPAAQAAWFHAQCQGFGLEPGRDAFAIDWEVTGSDVRAFLTAWDQLTGEARIGVYVSPAFWAAYADGDDFPGDWLWFASWLSAPRHGDPREVLTSGGQDGKGVTPGYQPTGAGARKYLLRQFTEQASLDGEGPFDCSVHYGSVDQLREALGIPALVVAPKPVEPAPAPASLTLHPPTLKAGDRGQPVLLLEGLLLAHSYGPHGLANAAGRPDGVFGPEVTAAVENFQHLHGLDVDGVVGLATWAQLLLF